MDDNNRTTNLILINVIAKVNWVTHFYLFIFQSPMQQKKYAFFATSQREEMHYCFSPPHKQVCMLTHEIMVTIIAMNFAVVFRTDLILKKVAKMMKISNLEQRLVWCDVYCVLVG